MAISSYSWKFSRIGGFDQALIRSADDLRNLPHLDAKLWAALSCPVRGLKFCERTLELIDSDKDGRVREPEVKAATAWACSVLKDPGLLLNPKDELRISDLNDSSDEGKALAASATEILNSLAKDKSAALSLADIAEHQKGYAKQAFNGDGFVNLNSASDDDVRATLTDIISAFPAVKDPFGNPGVDKATLDAFFKLCEARLAWLETKAATNQNAKFSPADALPAYSSVSAKIDDYFARAAILQFQASAAPNVNVKESDWNNVTNTLLTADVSEIASFPLAVIEANSADALTLSKGLNPAWRASMETFVKHIIAPQFGELSILSRSQWLEIKEIFKPYISWQASEVANEISSIKKDRLHTLLQSDQKTKIEDLLQRDLALVPQANNFLAVERILRYRLHLVTLLNNFVNFVDFYSQDKNSIFQAGTLYLDGRACHLCIEVFDAAKHKSLAGLSKCFLAYCVCTRPNGERKEIVAAFTGGDSDYLLVGRNGVFMDRDGKDWDATITSLIENPISIMQAFFAPYKRLIRFIEEQAAKKASAADASADSMLVKSTESAASAASGKSPKEKPKFDIGIVAAIGVAVGGLATAFGMLLQAFFGLGMLMPLGLIGLLLAISGPSMFIAWLKLRQRNLGPILDAGGWAINGRVKINLPFGAKLTEVAKLPKNAQRELRDPFQEKSFPWGKVIVLGILLFVGASSLYYKTTSHHWPWEQQKKEAVHSPN